jgi:hypothetical protein
MGYNLDYVSMDCREMLQVEEAVLPAVEGQVANVQGADDKLYIIAGRISVNTRGQPTPQLIAAGIAQSQAFALGALTCLQAVGFNIGNPLLYTSFL